MSTANTDNTVFTLADLVGWTRPGTHLAVLGHPIAHSLSPLMHNAALAEMAAHDPRYRDWHYHRFDITPEDLPRALTLFRKKQFRGLNLTVPHKVIAFDDATVTEIDPAAKPIGAINTLAWTPAGWHGFNTDGYGLAAAIRETLNLDLANQHILLLGAGGAARGAAIECLHRHCASLTIANRTRTNLDALLTQLAPIAAASDIPLSAFQSKIQNPSTSPRVARQSKIVINATSSGLHPDDPVPIDLTQFPPAARPAAVFDMIYNPPQTRLLAQAAALGIPHANGLSMLVHQGARALEIWTAATVPVSAMRQAIEASHNSKTK